MKENYCLGDVRYYKAKGEFVPFIFNKNFKKIKNLIMDEIIELDFSKYTDYERAVIYTIKKEMQTDSVQIFNSLFELYFEYLYGIQCESEIARELCCLLGGGLDYMALRSKVVEYSKRKIVHAEDLAEFSLELTGLMQKKDNLEKTLNQDNTTIRKIQEMSREF